MKTFEDRKNAFERKFALVGEEVRQMLRTDDDGDAGHARRLNDIEALPTDAGVCVADVDLARAEPFAEALGRARSRPIQR